MANMRPNIFDAHTHPYCWTVDEELTPEQKAYPPDLRARKLLTTSWGRQKFWKSKFKQDPIDKSDIMIRDMDVNKISKALVMSWIYHVENEFISQIVQRHKNRLLGFGKWLSGSNPEEKARQAKKAIKEFKLVGIGEWSLLEFYPMPPDDIHISPEFTIPMDMIAKLKVPILIDTGWTPVPLPLKYVHPMLVDDIANVYPDVPIIMGHAGKLERYFHEPALFVARKHDNVYLEFSYQTARNLEDAVEKVGADRCLFGTDWTPLSSNIYDKNLEIVRRAKVTEDERDLILSKNLENLLKL